MAALRQPVAFARHLVQRTVAGLRERKSSPMTHQEMEAFILMNIPIKELLELAAAVRGDLTRSSPMTRNGVYATLTTVEAILYDR